MALVDALLLAGWGAFWLYWLVAAFGVKRTRSRAPSYGSVGIRVAIALVAVLLVRTRVLTAGLGIVDSIALQVAGLCVFASGLLVAVWARMNLGRNWGTPMSEKLEAELVTSGPYRYVRHPIYSGLILATLGTALALGVYWLIVAALLSAYFVYSALVEERSMTRLFPETYPTYRRSTKMLVPFLI